MARVKRGVTTHARHQKVLKAAKGYDGANNFRDKVNHITEPKEMLELINLFF